MSTSNSLLLAILLSIVVFVVSYAGTRKLIDLLSRWGVFDNPNHRSSHEIPTPRGGGIALLTALLPSWLLTTKLFPETPEGLSTIIAVAIIFAIISWVDDVRGVGAASRLLMQIAGVGAALALAPLPGPVFGGWLPQVIDLVFTVLIWVWFINLFNFMDGIDGIAGAQAVTIGIGVFLVAVSSPLDGFWGALGLMTGAAAAGFLRWNWYPARIFLGDVGSVPLGFLLGWLLINLAASGYHAPALILPIYFVTDASITLIRRAVGGKKVWKAHREHFYQLALQNGLRHNQVAGIILIANTVLVVWAWLAMQDLAFLAITGAVATVFLLIFILMMGKPEK